MSERFSLLKPEKAEENVQQEGLYTEKHINFSKGYGTPLYGHLFTRTYGAIIDMYDGQKDKKSRVQFEAEVTIRKFPDEGYFEYKIQKKNVFINRHTPKTLVEKLSVRTLEVLYPLELKTTLKNELLDILNHKEILERWEKVKSQLQREYTGEAMEKYLSKFENRIHQKYALLECLKHEVFYTLLFHDIYTSYNPSFQKETSIAFPLIGFKSPLVFNGIQKIDKHKTYYNTANTSFEAQVKNDPIEASLGVEYDLDGNTFLLENVIANCTIKHNETILKTVNVSVYHLKEKPTIRRSFEDMRDDIRRRQRIQRKKENKNLTLKQRFIKWLDT